jgi:hypothetical protein
MTLAGPSERALRIVEAMANGQTDVLDSLIHPDMVLSSFLVPDRVLRGRDEVLRTVRERVGPMYDLHVRTVEDLSPTAAVGSGSVRYTSQAGVITTQQLHWLWTFDEAGLMTSSTTFSSLDAALSRFEELA